MRLAAQHHARTPDQAATATATALRRWGERVPAALVPSHDELLARHRQRWLADAAAALTTLDWRSFTGGRSLHVVDFESIGAFTGINAAREMTFGLVVGADLHRLAGAAIPTLAGSTPAAAIAINITGICRAFEPDGATDEAFIRAVATAVALHEYAHHAVAVAAGETLPDHLTHDHLRAAVAAPLSLPAGQRRQAHGPQWARAYSHLVARARQLPYRKTRETLFADDVEPYAAGGAAAVLAALADELAAHTADDPLAEILRTPAPAGLTALFPAIDDQAEAACDVAASRV